MTRPNKSSSLEAVFNPGSVAVYGASRQPGKLGHTLLRNVESGGFSGRVIAVNPSLGVSTLPEACDLALISVPAASALAAVADAARAGCRCGVVLASGFGE